jgi:hypothetical protein
MFVPLVLALIGVWALLFKLTLSERRATLERVQSLLGFTVASVADFNELAQLSRNGSAADTGANRTATFWRALLQYPSASILGWKPWRLTAGQRPQGDRGTMESAARPADADLWGTGAAPLARDHHRQLLKPGSL